ncbi:hypothetical protein [Opitutus terrae]|uniref:CopG-like ribbon-helix-helix domain-containing protein n=1 Tax=Opitutus terrae (strain DSM 11246 / JCM 15787 / PB90-1) TaxID=452637 RepID=B1ZPR6_OPITP|nr:hypothetical protein [Opitutus terrae]ACB75519.1 hypothetical protein Oter_2236 [Opitutus terrae PB90-1]
MSADPKKSFLLRMDPELWRELEAWAAAELRSVNGQVEYLLREAVRQRKGTPPPGNASAASSPDMSAEDRQRG